MEQTMQKTRKPLIYKEKPCSFNHYRVCSFWRRWRDSNFPKQRPNPLKTLGFRTGCSNSVVILFFCYAVEITHAFYIIVLFSGCKLAVDFLNSG